MTAGRGTGVLGVGLVAAVLMLGCEGDRPPPPRPGVGHGGPAPGADPAEPGETRAPAAPAGSPAHRPKRDAPAPSPGAPSLERPSPSSPEGTTDQNEQDRERATRDRRDLGAELHGAIGDPVACLPSQGQEELPDAVTVRVQAHVSLTGVVTRAEARSSDLPDEALRCISARARRARLQSPIEGAPRRVSTTLTLRRRPAEGSGGGP
ncbi:MAG: hypothetical protein ACODAU_06745 [Myxococcota bacterium]